MATTVGEVKIALSFDGKSMDASMKSVASKTQTTAGNIGTNSGNALSKGWAVAIGAVSGITQSVFNKVTNIISNSVGSAVKRFDTMNNFPKVMANLGISADKAEGSIQKIADNLKGLPTTLDQGASAVQRFTTINGDLEKSTDLFLAVNNAILAGGAPVDQQATALEQLSQAYSKGKPDMMEWRSIQTAMPAQLKQVAQAMGMTTNALGEGLRDGSISMDEFLDTIQRLNKEGVGEFASFEEQAKGATGGVATSMANLQSAVSRGITKIMDAIGKERIAEIISGIGTALERLLTAAAPVFNFLIDNFDLVLAALGALMAMNVATKIMGIISTVKTLGGVVSALFSLISLNPVVLVIGAIVAALILVMTHLDQVKAFFGSVFDAISNIVANAINFIKTNFGGMYNAIKTYIEMLVGFWKAVFGTAVNIIKGQIEAFGAVFRVVFNAIKGYIEIVVNFWRAVFGSIFSYVSGVVNGIGNVFNAVLNGVRTAIEGIKSAFVNVFGSIGGIIKGPINGIISGINAVINKINSIQVPDWVPGIGGAHTNFPTIPMLASGGITTGATHAIIGEAGTEAVLPLDRNTGNWSGLLADTLLEEMAAREFAGAGFKVEMNNYINNEMDADEIGRRMMASIRRAI